MTYLSKREKKDSIIKLLSDGKTYREIQTLVHITPNFISTTLKEKFGEDNIITNLNPKLSKNSKAAQLFYEGKFPIIIARELDMDAN